VTGENYAVFSVLCSSSDIRVIISRVKRECKKYGHNFSWKIYGHFRGLSICRRVLLKFISKIQGVRPWNVFMCLSLGSSSDILSTRRSQRWVVTPCGLLALKMEAVLFFGTMVSAYKLTLQPGRPTL
jgi:hypothetical protein